METKIVSSEPFLSTQIIEIEENECPYCGEITYYRVTQLNNWASKREILSLNQYLDIMFEQRLSELN